MQSLIMPSFGLLAGGLSIKKKSHTTIFFCIIVNIPSNSIQKQQKMKYFDHLSGERSTRKLVEIHKPSFHLINQHWIQFAFI